MSRFTDYKSILDLDMKVWDARSIGYSPDCSQDIIDYNSYDDNLHAYIVDDVSSVVEYANDWERYETEDDANEHYYSREHDAETGRERTVFSYVYNAFRVKPEFLDKFGIDADSSAIINLSEIMRLSKEWDAETEDILDECIWLEMKGE